DWKHHRKPILKTPETSLPVSLGRWRLGIGSYRQLVFYLGQIWIQLLLHCISQEKL
uniref:Uncharacterized protein n=1 Tax=Amphimedon queenslandica TaxID=400682 RepID=A0A1X7UJY1_AMPQE